MNKLFHSEFVVYLHRKLDTAVERLDAESPHLVHTRTLIARTLLGPHDLVDGAFNKIVQRLLARMPRLEAFVSVETQSPPNSTELKTRDSLIYLPLFFAKAGPVRSTCCRRPLACCAGHAAE